ncbi:MAG: glycogen-binding domain-containing protein [Elusimicrobia bacterium]|nr:glycogen-binding domain-containing protein [Elusimicrobiota bacterium]
MAIKKSKSFWMIIILVNIAIVSTSGYIIYTRLNTHFSSEIEEIHPTPVPGVVPVPAPLSNEAQKFLDENTTSQVTDEQETLASNPLPEEDTTLAKPSVITSAKKDSVKVKKTSEKIKAVKTIFVYKNLNAKSVSVSGSFTKWKNIKMEKKKGVWQADIWILPGTYLFHYVVDGQNTLDSSKPKASIGESVIAVND